MPGKRKPNKPNASPNRGKNTQANAGVVGADLSTPLTPTDDEVIARDAAECAMASVEDASPNNRESQSGLSPAGDESEAPRGHGSEHQSGVRDVYEEMYASPLYETALGAPMDTTNAVNPSAAEAKDFRTNSDTHSVEEASFCEQNKNEDKNRNERLGRKINGSVPRTDVQTLSFEEAGGRLVEKPEKRFKPAFTIMTVAFSNLERFSRLYIEAEFEAFMFMATSEASRERSILFEKLRAVLAVSDAMSAEEFGARVALRREYRDELTTILIAKDTDYRAVLTAEREARRMARFDAAPSPPRALQCDDSVVDGGDESDAQSFDVPTISEARDLGCNVALEADE